MHVLITGGLGHIGSQLIRDFAKVDFIEKIRILDNLSTQRYCSLFDLPDNAQYEFIEGDILDEAQLNSAMNGIDAVIHLAAVTNAPETFSKKEKTEEVNFIGTKKVLEACKKNNIKKIIFPSTTSVYGPTKGIAKEDCNPEDLKPQSPYAEFKLKAEKAIIDKCKEGHLSGVVLRFGTVFGSSVGMRFHTAINKFIFLACSNRPLKVWKTALNQKRPYLDLRDAVKAIVFMLEREKLNGEVYNVVTANMELSETIDAIKEFIPGIKIEFTDSPLINQMSYFTDSEKLKKLGFGYTGNLRDGIKQTISLLNSLK
tara:strand:- start:1736 stop:2674 length:939 start_codon:yes stop_codon:yes gene_type:complete